MRSLAGFLRANPQALLLLIICVVLGLGTFIVVVIALAGSSNGTPNEAVDGVIALGRLVLMH